MHTPVLVKEAIDGLNIQKEGLYIDATAGEGGHLREIADRGGKVLGIDIDLEQIEKLKPRLISYKKIKLVRGNFADIEKIAKANNFYPVMGILFDLGLSMNQLNSSGRGFSYKKLAEPLDMRLDTSVEAGLIPASELINSLSGHELYELFSNNSEEINSLAISQAVVRARSVKPISKVGDLLDLIDQVLEGRSKEVYARIFQALRMEVNSELENLSKALFGSLKILKKKGKVAIISFHSIEDRLVKQFIKNNHLLQLNKKVIRPVKPVGFQKSAKLRIIENT